MIVDRLRSRFGAEVSLKPPRVPYQETIRARRRPTDATRSSRAVAASSATATSRSSRSSRAPASSSSTAIKGGAIPRSFIPAVEKGVREAMDHGVLAGYPVKDVRVTLFDGSFHTVDSSELAFKLAGSLAMQAGARAGEPRAARARSCW